MLQGFPVYAYIPARDVERARRFYEGKLGFRPKQDMAGGVIHEFGGKTACFLYPTPNAGTSRASQAFWQVDDVEREVAEFKARGVAFEDCAMPVEKSPSGVVTAGGAKAAWFKDSAGNILVSRVGNSLNKTDEMNAILRCKYSQGTRPCSVLRLVRRPLHQFYFSTKFQLRTLAIIQAA